MADVERRCWDACCFIAVLNGEGDIGHTCLDLLNDAKRNAVEIVVSSVCLVEVVRPKGVGSPVPRAAQEQIAGFFENDYIQVRLLDREVAEFARELCWTQGVKPRDAIHIATAVNMKCRYFETKDDKLLDLGFIEGVELRKPKPLPKTIPMEFGGE